MLIRPPQTSDENAWRTLWQDYGDFYGVNVDPSTTDALWRRLVQAGDEVFGRLVQVDDDVVGFAVCVLHPITWATSPACLLDDLFVSPAHRGRGFARGLIEHLVTEAEQNDWARLYWHTQRDNDVARRLYDSFAPADGVVRYTLAFTGTVEPAVE